MRLGEKIHTNKTREKADFDWYANRTVFLLILLNLINEMVHLQLIRMLVVPVVNSVSYLFSSLRATTRFFEHATVKRKCTVFFLVFATVWKPHVKVVALNYVLCVDLRLWQLVAAEK
jgi:hypothetical protein